MNDDMLKKHNKDDATFLFTLINDFVYILTI